MSYLMSYVILSPYVLTALVYVLLLRLIKTYDLETYVDALCLVSFSRILEDMFFLSFLRICILLEGPPHLTADNHWHRLLFLS